MADNVQYTSGTPGMYNDDRDGGAIIPHPVIGIVKDNIDEKHAGRIRVFLTDYGGGDPENDKSWTTVSYLSPWFGSTTGSAASGEYGKFTSNPQSYGFWASAPDIGTKVICVFINGKPSQGYYIGGIPNIGQHYMVPAIAAAKNVVPSGSEATTYGGSPRVPTVEANNNNPENKDSPNQPENPKPLHSFQSSILSNQGLIRDPIRGVISSSSMRETPSAVFGMSTPGAPIWEGGYTRQNIQSALKGADSSKLKVIGRTGGHSLVMDDGELFTGQNQMLRLRSAGGHQITMSDDGQVLFITHSNGNTWVELGPQGTIDMYSRNSFNVRTQGDLNLHADLNVNIHAGKNFNVNAENINMQSRMDTTVRVGGGSTFHTVGSHTHKAGAAYSVSAAGDASLAGATTFITGKPINLNTGSSGTQPKEVPVVTPVAHVETQFSTAKGWMNPGQSPTNSITSRLPTHQPWALAGKGIDDSDIPDNVAEVPPASDNALSTTMMAVAAAPPASMVTPEQAKTVPTDNSQTPGAPLDPATKQAITAQNAMDVAKMTDAEKQKAGIIPGAAGLSLKQLELGGILKAGVAFAAGALMARGIPFTKAVSNNSFTGSMGVTNAESLVADSTVQAKIASKNIDNAGLQLIDMGIIPSNPSPTEVAGLVNAVHMTSAGQVADTLAANAANTSLPAQATNQTTSGTTPSSSGGSSSNSVLTAISAGAIAAGVASSFLKGAGGLPTSLTDLKNSLTGGLDSALSGIKNGVAGALNDIKGKLTGQFDALKAAGQKAFAAAEASFANLKAGFPNSLSGALPSELNPTQKAANDYTVAMAEKKTAQADLLAAKRLYNDDMSPENLAKVQAAEAAIAAADKKIAASSSSFLNTAKGALSSVTSGLSTQLTSGLKNVASNALSSKLGISAGAATSAINGLSDLASKTASPADSGINALPGGLKAFVSETGLKATTATKDAFLSAVGGKATTLAAITSVDAKAALDKLKSAGSTLGISLQTDASALAGGAGAAIPATIAGASEKGAAITAKLGALVGDSRVPIPTTKPVEPSPDMSMQQVDAQVAAKEKALKDLKLQKQILEVFMAKYGAEAASSETASYLIKKQQMAVAAAEKAYADLLNSDQA